jgi:Protein of unknown function (DUF705)
MSRPLVVYVDVDETLVRNYGTSRIPIPRVIEQVRLLKAENAVMYCWSSGGAEYAQNSARELGLEDCFVGFLAKPTVYLDDQAFSDWRSLVHVLPSGCGDLSAADLEGQLQLARSKQK